MHPRKPLQMPWNDWNKLHLEFQWIYRLKGNHSGWPQNNASDCYIAFWIHREQMSKKAGNQLVSAKKGEWIFQQPGNVLTRFGPQNSYTEVAFYLRWHGKGRLLLLPTQKLWKLSPMPDLEYKTLQLYEIARKNVRVANYSMRIDRVPIEAHYEMRKSFHLWFMTMLEEWRKQGVELYLLENEDERIVRAKWLMDQQPLNQSISVKSLATKIGFSAKHFTMLFLQQYGMAPKQYWMQLKLKEALYKLQTTEEPIEQIATHLGCGNPWFYRWIKKETGMTPLQIRRRQRLRRK